METVLNTPIPWYFSSFLIFAEFICLVCDKQIESLINMKRCSRSSQTIPEGFQLVFVKKKAP